MILQFIRGGLSNIDMASLMIYLAATAVILIICLPVHECAHAWMAKRLGDNTAWMQGRLTLNPAKHVVALGSLMIIFVGFGYAKPVPVNARNFRNYKKDMALTAAAGPASNLLLAVISCLILNIMYLFPLAHENELLQMLALFFEILFSINVSLMVFNLIPIPPLDGMRIFDLILPSKASWFISQHENILRWAVLVLVMFGGVIGWISDKVGFGISWLVGLPFRLI